jgi:hypothetical protein
MSDVIRACPICGKHAEQEPPNVLMVKSSEVGAFGGQETIWSRCGYAHPECAARPSRGFRVAGPGE